MLLLCFYFTCHQGSFCKQNREVTLVILTHQNYLLSEWKSKRGEYAIVIHSNCHGYTVALKSIWSLFNIYGTLNIFKDQKLNNLQCIMYANFYTFVWITEQHNKCTIWCLLLLTELINLVLVTLLIKRMLNEIEHYLWITYLPNDM